MKKAIIGAGGFAREVYHQMKEQNPMDEIHFFADEEYCDGVTIFPLDQLMVSHYEVFIAVGDPNLRKHFLRKLPRNVRFGTFIHRSTQIFDKHTISIGEGTIICAGCILTTNIKIGKHCHLNLQTSVGHDTIINDFVTTAPKVSISGNCKIDDEVYIGTNAAIKQQIKVAKGVSIGMGAMVVKDIKEQRTTWVGVPAKQLK